MALFHLFFLFLCLHQYQIDLRCLILYLVVIHLKLYFLLRNVRLQFRYARGSSRWRSVRWPLLFSLYFVPCGSVVINFHYMYVRRSTCVLQDTGADGPPGLFSCIEGPIAPASAAVTSS